MRAEAKALARELVAHPRWTWPAGVRDAEFGGRLLIAPGKWQEGKGCGAHWSDGVRCDGYTCCPHCEPESFAQLLPDLDDLATMGALYGVLVEADRGAGWFLSHGPDTGWQCSNESEDHRTGDCPGEAVGHALIGALDRQLGRSPS